MRPSYSLYPCTSERKPSKYEEMLELADLDRRWEGSDDYYSLSEDGLYYQYAYNGGSTMIRAAMPISAPTKSLSAISLPLTWVSSPRAAVMTTCVSSSGI